MKVRRIAAGLLLAAAALVTGVTAAPAASAAPGRPAALAGTAATGSSSGPTGAWSRASPPRAPISSSASRTRRRRSARCAGRRRSRRRAGRASGRPRRTAAGARSWPAATAPGWTTRTACTSTSTRRRALDCAVRPGAPRARHDPRRRAHHRRGRPARRVADRHDRPHHRRVDQLPARPVRLPRRCPGSALGRGRRERQLRPARPGGRAALGAAQHRRVRRRPGQGHDRRRVGGRLVGLRAADLAAGPRAVPRRDHGKRQLRLAEPGHRPGREPRVRQAGRAARTRRPRRRACARCRRRRCSTPAPATSPSSPTAAPSCRSRTRRRWPRGTTTGCRCSWAPTTTRAARSPRASPA